MRGSDWGCFHYLSHSGHLRRRPFLANRASPRGKDRLLSCSLGFTRSERNNYASATDLGLIGSHEYAILRAVEVAGKRFVLLKHPSTSSTKDKWIGKWSDGDSAWTSEWLAVSFPY
ncbi:hypothetical protein DL96DRAFT_726580 [Flagelloscypha sp. PMI_526]|nr:hypothetical protein DL96DRAFT_726580 [Flagelloscypha sp. PMI_526]